MKIRFTIILSIIHFTCFAQDKMQGKLDVWDSLYLHHQQVEDSFNSELKKDYGRSDTTTTKDSITISFLAKSGQLQKKILYRLDSTGCRDFVYYKWFNRKEQVVYTKRFGMTCPDKSATNYRNTIFHTIHYERFEYDTYGRLILYVDTWADRPYRIKYIYNPDGTIQRISKKISHTDFWK